jgi:hypothetical protein
MFTHIQTSSSHLHQDGAMKKIHSENLFLISIAFLVLTAISCHKYSLPTMPSDRDDVDVWNSVQVDQSGGGSIIAALYPDGIPHLYDGTTEYSCNNNVWSKRSINPEAPEMMITRVGRCRNDGILRMYGVTSTNVYEFNYTGNQWTRQIIASLSGGCRFAIGDLRNDGFESLYIYDGSGLHEVRYQGAAWENTVVDFTPDIGDISGGDGRGDGKGGIYMMSYYSEIFELRNETGLWKRTKIGQIDSLPPNVMEAYFTLSVTNTHNGMPNVVASTGDLYEFYYDTDHWTKVRAGSEPGVKQISDGVGRNDGVNRIYCAVCFDIMAEYTLISGCWVKTSQRKTGASAALIGVVVGPARGDGINRIYVTKFLGGLYEFTCSQ